MRNDVSPISHILVGVNGSDAACRAADKAVQLAAALGARITFLGVATDEIKPDEIAAYVAAEGMDALPMPIMSKEAEKCLKVASETAAREGVERVSVEIRKGSLLDVLQATASSVGADTIVLGRSKSTEWISSFFFEPLRRLPRSETVVFF